MDGMSGLTASDVALLNDGGMNGSNGLFWIFALLILAGGGFGGFGNNNGYNQFATAASQNEILSGQHFDRISQQINAVGDGISSLGYSQLQQMDANTASINGNIVNEGRSIQSQLCAINSNIDNKFASLEKSQLQSQIDAQAQKINELSMQSMMAGVVRYPMSSTWSMNGNPFCGGCCNY